MNENTEFKNKLITKWLRVLMYIAIVSLINSFFIPTFVATWISRGFMVAMVVCMFQLAPVNERYKKAGIMRAAMLGCTLITAFLFASSILTLAASILSIIAVYQECSAHSELICEMDFKLSHKWKSLFYWNIVTGLLVSLGSVVAVLLVAMVEMDAVRATGLIVALLSIPQLVIEVVYLLYIKKMLAILVDEREVQ